MADVVDDNPEMANEVLHFYASHAPQRLPMVVLESNLPVVPAAALDLLERSTDQESSANEFARALLYLVRSPHGSKIGRWLTVCVCV